MIITLCRLKNALNNSILGWSVWCQFCCLIQHIFFCNLNRFRRYSGLLRRLHWWALAWLQLWSINVWYTKLGWLWTKSEQFIKQFVIFLNRRNISNFSKFPLILAAFRQKSSYFCTFKIDIPEPKSCRLVGLLGCS